MSWTTASTIPVAAVGSLGRWFLGLRGRVLPTLERVGGYGTLLAAILYHCCVAPFTGKSQLRKQLFPMMANAGARSLPIVALVGTLTGAVLVLQTGYVMERFGQIQEVPGLVALSMTRELGPLMTAIVLIARVGASYTAVLGSMNINEEILALRTMAIHPIGYLVAPRFVAMVVMVPCLVVFSYLVGMVGGGVVGFGVYDIPMSIYIEKSIFYLSMQDILGGMLKGLVFGVLTSLISCYYGLNTTGGPTGLGRNIMVSVVTCLVMVVFADAVLTAFVTNYL